MRTIDCPYCGPLANKLHPKLVYFAEMFAHQKTVSFPMGLALVINAITTAAQGTTAIRLPDGSLESIHRIDLVVAEPESGKDSLFRLVYAPLLAFEKEVDAIRLAALAAGRALPARHVLLRSDKTAELIEAIEGNGQSTTVALTDGGALLKSRYFTKELQVTCELWNGQTRVSLRDAKSKLKSASDPAVSFIAMPQDKPMSDYLSRMGTSAITTGLLQRCSITWPSGCFHDPPHVNSSLTAGYDHLMRQLLGDPARFAQGEVTALQGIPLAPAAEKRYLELLELQSAAKRAGRPAPWRALQKALRTSLPMELLSWILAHPPQDAHIAASVNADLEHQHVCLRPRAPIISAEFLEALGCPPQAGSRPAPMEISLASFEAAWAYTQWLHAHPRTAALMAQSLDSRTFNEFKPLPTTRLFKLNTAEKKRMKTIEDMDEILRKHEEHSDRIGHHLGVSKRDLFKRTGIYQQRFETALVRLTDEGYLVEEVVDVGRPPVLRRTAKRYQYRTPYPFGGSSEFGGYPSFDRI